MRETFNGIQGGEMSEENEFEKLWNEHSQWKNMQPKHWMKKGFEVGRKSGMESIYRLILVMAKDEYTDWNLSDVLDHIRQRMEGE